MICYGGLDAREVPGKPKDQNGMDLLFDVPGHARGSCCAPSAIESTFGRSPVSLTRRDPFPWLGSTNL